MKIYQMVEKYKVSESVPLAGKTLVQYLWVFWTYSYLKISILGPKSDFCPKLYIYLIPYIIPYWPLLALVRVTLG